MVLPEAQPDGDHERRDAHEHPRPQLVEVVDDAQALVVPDRP
jgi:hypothetical protein